MRWHLLSSQITSFIVLSFQFYILLNAYDFFSLSSLSLADIRLPCSYLSKLASSFDTLIFFAIFKKLFRFGLILLLNLNLIFLLCSFGFLTTPLKLENGLKRPIDDEELIFGPNSNLSDPIFVSLLLFKSKDILLSTDCSGDLVLLDLLSIN